MGFSENSHCSILEYMKEKTQLNKYDKSLIIQNILSEGALKQLEKERIIASSSRE